MQQKSKQKRLKAALPVIFTALIFLAVILIGANATGERKYFAVSLILLAGSMLPFFIHFERRRTQARELVTLSVLCAIAVAGRAAFYMIPQFKPVAAIVILTGACLGPQSGFLVGAVSLFVSNFFFGQGPNTPYQMFAFGLLGVLSGILYNRGLLKSSRVSLCLFGGLSTLLLYGGIVNLGTLLLSGLPPTLSAYFMVCLTSLPFDLIHAASSVFFLFVLSKPMIQKIERMKTKYGLFSDKK